MDSKRQVIVFSSRKRRLWPILGWCYKINQGILNILGGFSLSKNQFELIRANPRIIQKLFTSKSWGKTPRVNRQKRNKEVTDWLQFKAQLAIGISCLQVSVLKPGSIYRLRFWFAYVTIGHLALKPLQSNPLIGLRVVIIGVQAVERFGIYCR